MTISVTATVLNDSERLVQVHLALESDAAADLTKSIAVNASELTPPYTDTALVKVEYGLIGFAVGLYFDGAPDLLICALPQDYQGCIDFEPATGGFANRALDKTGDILFSTFGAGAGDVGFLILTVQKRAKAQFTL